MSDEYGKHFIRDVDIKNYKCFQDFRAEGFERVNLIGGMNNVGKTALLEALFLNTSSKNLKCFLTGIASIDFVRYQMDILNNAVNNEYDDIEAWKKSIEKFSDIYILTNQYSSSLVRERGELSAMYKAVLNGKESSFLLNELSHESVENVDSINYLEQYGESSEELKESYAGLQKRDKEKWLNSQIGLFESDIDSFKFISDVPSCRKISIDQYLDIHEFGDGLKSFVSILCNLWRSSEGYLFIDEVDNGIHYSKFDQLWELILTVSKETNCQVFATTHSKECLESYDRVSKKLADKEITYNHLKRKKDGSIINQNYKADELHNAIESNHEVRGW